MEDIPIRVRDIYAVYCLQYLQLGFFDSKSKKEIQTKMKKIEDKYPSINP